MSKIIKTLTVSDLTCVFFLSITSAVPAREKIVDLTIKGETLSAKLKEIPLKDILEKLKVVKNLPPPGGTASVSEEVLESLKTVKNMPPPGS